MSSTSLSPSTRPRRRLATSLLLAFLITALLPVIVLTSFSAVTQSRLAREGAFEKLAGVAAAKTQQIDSWIASSQASLELSLADEAILNDVATVLAERPRSPAFREAVADFNAHANPQLEPGGPFSRIMLADNTGRVVLSTDPAALDWDVVDYPFYEDGRTLATVSTPTRDLLSNNEWSVFFATPLHDQEGALLGVLIGQASTSVLNSLATERTGLGQTGEILLVTQQRGYVTELRFGDQELYAESLGIARALEGVDGQASYRDYRGELVLGVYRWLPQLGVAMVVKQDAAEALAPSRALVRTNVITAVVAAAVALTLGFVFVRRLTRPIVQLTETAVRIAEGDRSLRVEATSEDELGALAGAFNEMTERVQELVDTLEERVAQRTRDLETTAEISRAISAVRDMDELLRQVTEKICERYGYYHAQVFLLDELGEFAVLRASTGRAGRLLLEGGHKLAVGSQSVIGQVTKQGRYIVARDTDTSPIHRRNELLPDTRSELALPLLIGDEVIGALDVQSVEPDAFSESTIEVLQAVASQLSIAINNARLFEESRALLDEQLRFSQLLTREGWTEYLRREAEVKGYTYDLAEVRPLDGEASDGGAEGLKAQIQLRGEVIGELVSLPAEEGGWDEDDRLLVEAVAERVALALENARLFGQTQESLQEIGRLYQAGRALVEAGDLDELLQAVIHSAVRDWVEHIAVILIGNPDLGFELSGAEVRAEWYRDPDTPRSPHVPLASAMLPLFAGMGREACVVSDFDTDESIDATSKATLTGFGHKSGIYLPLFASSGQVLGWLAVAATSRPYKPGQDDLRYYQALAAQAGTAIDSHRLFEQAQQRARKLQATNAVSQAAASILDIDVLMPEIVNLIRDSFGFYHVQVFLVDEEEGMAVLHASTGEVGEELLARGHKLPIGSRSVIGKVTAEGVPVIARDIDTEPVHMRNELLPATRSEMAIPLRHGGRVVGALDVQSTSTHAFTDEDLAILQTLADQLAIALENARLFQDTQERVAELTTVNLISQEVSRARTLDALFETVSNQLVRAFEATDGFLALYDRQANRLMYPIWLEGGQLVEVEPSSPEPGPIARVIESGAALMLNENVAQVVKEMGGRPESVRAKSWLGVPLTIGDEVIGVLGIQDPQREKAYDEGHQRMLSTLAAYVAVAVRNAQLFAETEQRVSELGFLLDVTSAALGPSDLDETLQRVAESVSDEMEGAEATVVALLDESGQFLIPRAAAGYGREIVEHLEEAMPLGEGLAGWVAAHGEPVVVGDVRQDPRYVAASPRTLSEMAVPLMVADELVGVLLVESSQLNAFGDDDLRLLQTLSGTLSAIVQNTRLIEEIQAANEQLRELDKMKMQFLANMSHELRTPLNSIIGFSRVILKGIDGPLTELQEQDLQTIYSSGQHLLGLINDVLDMSKIEAGKLDLSREMVNLQGVIEGVMSTAVALVKGKPIELITDVQPDLPEVYADEMRIRQVLLNLLSNAAKFTSEGSITLRAFAVDETEDEPAHVQLSIIDTGIGIAEEDVDGLFEAFSQVDASATRTTGGTGLGLSISRSLVELSGGRIWVESKEGVGSTFSFTIPLHPQPTQTEPIPSFAPDNGGRPVVLAVDDEESVLDLYRRFLEEEGYAVVGLTSGHGVVDAVRQTQPVAIVLDVMMPDRDGWEVVADLKLNPDTKDVPIILCTIAQEKERARRLGVDDYLVKPILEDDLLAALRRLGLGGDGRVDGQGNGRAAGGRDSRAAGRDGRPAQSETRTVLVIDAEPDFMKLICDGLQANNGYSVATALGGRAGLEAVRERKPDLIVLGLAMPEMDGFQVLAKLEEDPATRDIPVLVLAAGDLSPEEYGRLTEQAVSLVKKESHSREELLKSIANALDGMQ